MQIDKPAGYSGTPLARKLGLKAGLVVLTRNVPKDYLKLLQSVPDGVEFSSRVSSRVGMVHLFSTKAADLTRELAKLRTALNPDAAIWVSWPKKAARVATDITEDVIRSVALPLGFVDIKVCAVSDVWSGLKLVVRENLRSA